MILARVFSNIYREGGIILVDSRGQKYICGNPRKNNPITVKLLKGLELGNSGIISAICNVTAPLARKVFDDFEKKKEQTQNDKLIAVRQVFDDYNLISALHSYMSVKDNNFKNLLPPLVLLNSKEKKDLVNKLNNLKFVVKKNLAA